MPSDDATIAAGSKAPGGAGPLNGFRVVELAMWVAGPSAAGTLADWGADVIKIEPPQGDPQRHIFGALGHAVQTGVPPFEIDNRGKRSVVIDLGTPEGRERLDNILATADAFITNLRPAALERLALDHESVLGRFPRLVYGSLTGYGLDGPDRDRAGYDAGAFWARSGMAHTFAPPGELAPALRAGMGDHITGMTLAAGVLAKLLERERTNRGGLAATSLLRAGMYAIGWDFGVQLRFGRRERTRARHESRSPLTNSYLAADGKGFWLICLETDRHWPNLIVALDRPDLAGRSAVRRRVVAAGQLGRPGRCARRGVRVPPLPGMGGAVRRRGRLVLADQLARRGDRRPAGGGIRWDRRDVAARWRRAVSRDRLTGRLRPSPAAPGPGAVPRRAHGGCARRT